MPHKGQVDEYRFTPAWWEQRTVRDVKTGCLLWTGTACKLGYGRTWFQGRSGRPIHRVAYECFYGPFDKSLKVCHVCDVPNCIDPYHLFLGTQKDNLRDMFKKGRAKPNGRAVAGLTKKRQVSPTLATATEMRELASVNSHEDVATLYRIHHIRTLVPKESEGVAPAPWRTVIGVPPVQPTQAVVLWKRPLEWTGNRQPASNLSRGWLDGADAQPCRIGGRES